QTGTSLSSIFSRRAGGGRLECGEHRRFGFFLLVLFPLAPGKQSKAAMLAALQTAAAHLAIRLPPPRVQPPGRPGELPPPPAPRPLPPGLAPMFPPETPSLEVDPHALPPPRRTRSAARRRPRPLPRPRGRRGPGRAGRHPEGPRRGGLLGRLHARRQAPGD